MNLRLLRTLNLSFGIALILAVNAVGALPRMYKAMQRPVGPEIVSVYSPRGERYETLTPIMRHGSEEAGSIDTGQSVQVYVVNWYKDDEILLYPRRTFLIALGMVVVHLILTLLAWMLRQNSGATTN